MPTVLMPLLSDTFPYLNKGAYIQECYVKNLLQITHYMPNLRQKILELIVDRMLKIDVSCLTNANKKPLFFHLLNCSVISIKL